MTNILLSNIYYHTNFLSSRHEKVLQCLVDCMFLFYFQKALGIGYLYKLSFYLRQVSQLESHSYTKCKNEIKITHKLIGMIVSSWLIANKLLDYTDRRIIATEIHTC